MRDRCAVWSCNRIMRVVATRQHRDRLERSTKQKLADTMREAMDG